MSDTPISDFLFRCTNFHVHDVAVMFVLLHLQERMDFGESGGLIRPGVATKRQMLDGITDEEWAAAFERLVASGTVQWVESKPFRGGFVRGYRLTGIYDQLVEDMTDFGRRRYFRLRASESRRKSDEAIPSGGVQ